MKSEIEKVKEEIKELEIERAESEFGSVAYDFINADLFELVNKLETLKGRVIL